jgi:hypothetical protein
MAPPSTVVLAVFPGRAKEGIEFVSVFSLSRCIWFAKPGFVACYRVSPASLLAATMAATILFLLSGRRAIRSPSLFSSF